VFKIVLVLIGKSLYLHFGDVEAASCAPRWCPAVGILLVYYLYRAMRRYAPTKALFSMYITFRPWTRITKDASKLALAGDDQRIRACADCQQVNSNLCTS
jgi:hypothetical protein